MNPNFGCSSIACSQDCTASKMAASLIVPVYLGADHWKSDGGGGGQKQK